MQALARMAVCSIFVSRFDKVEHVTRRLRREVTHVSSSETLARFMPICILHADMLLACDLQFSKSLTSGCQVFPDIRLFMAGHFVH